MTLLPCGSLMEDLIAYADGELRAARKEVVEAHLKVCGQCRERLAAFAAVDRTLQAATPLVDDPNNRAVIRARLEQAARQSHLSWQRPTLIWLGVMVVLAIVVLLLLP